MSGRDDTGRKKGSRARLRTAIDRVRTAEELVRAFGKVRAISGRIGTMRGKVAAARGMKCPSCGGRAAAGTRFCMVCGADLTAKNLSASSAVRPRPRTERPVVLRRVAAQAIDRLLPLPFLVLVYPDWAWAVGAFHLVCEMWSGRSPGKLICRLRVVDDGTMKRCGPVRGMLRRVAVAAGQVAYCRWEYLPLAVAYDLVSLLFVWRERKGRRIEDLLFGTRVIGEGRYRNLKRKCAGCGQSISARARFCPHCGKRPG